MQYATHPRQATTITTKGITTTRVLARPMLLLAELVAGLRVGGGRLVDVCGVNLPWGLPVQIKYVSTESKSSPVTGKPQWLKNMLLILGHRC